MGNEQFIKELRKIYREGNLVPFIGTGLSLPFNVPDWGGLIKDCAIEMGIKDIKGTSFLPMIEFSLSNFDYWEGVRIIKKYLNRSDADIQAYIVEKIKNSISWNIDDANHNYLDLSKMNFKNYLTTNYDHILAKFLKADFMPVNLKDINSSTQIMLNEKRIFHLHGNISDSSSIVISEEKYRELYKSEKYKMLFSIFTATKTFLFIGFSFNDVFIQKIIEENNEFFKAKHYIILSNPEDKQIQSLKDKYNIETISYIKDDSSHSGEIRKILNKISAEDNDDDITELVDEFLGILIDTLPNTEKKKS